MTLKFFEIIITSSAIQAFMNLHIQLYILQEQSILDQSNKYNREQYSITMMSKLRARTEKAQQPDIHKHFRSLEFNARYPIKQIVPSPFVLPSIHSHSTHQKSHVSVARKPSPHANQATHILNQFVHNYFKRKTEITLGNNVNLKRSVSTIKPRELTLKRLKRQKAGKSNKVTTVPENVNTANIDVYFKTDWE